MSEEGEKSRIFGVLTEARTHLHSLFQCGSDIYKRTLGSQVSSAYSHGCVLLNTLYTCSLDVDKKLVATVKETKGG